MKDINIAMAWVLKAEGGYILDGLDPASERKYGIRKRDYPTLDIAGLTLDEALEIYRVDVYDAWRCNQMPGPIGLMLFDSLLQHRPETSVRMLQAALGASQNGIMDEPTVTLANLANPHAVVRLMALQRLDLVDAKIRADSTLANQTQAWRSRIVDLYEFTLANYLLDRLAMIVEDTEEDAA